MGENLKPFIVKAKKGETIFREGDAGNEMYFIHGGKVRIEKSIEGKPEILAVMEKGDFFGEMAVIDQIPRQASAVADEDTELLKVDGTNFETLLKSNIEIAIRMIRNYSARVRETNAKLEEVLKDRGEMGRGIKDILKSVKERPELKAEEVLLAEFIHLDSGLRYPVFQETICVGRFDPVTNIVPEVDLTSPDHLRSISRRHARLQVVEGEFLLTEEIGVVNGTFVDGRQVETGKPCKLTDGCRVKFGGVELQFKLPASGR